MNLINIFRYLIWKMSLDGVAFFESSVGCLNGIKLNCIYGGKYKRDISEIYYIDNTKINSIQQTYKFNQFPEKVAIFISPDVSIEDVFLSLHTSINIFYLSNNDIPKEKVLQNNFNSLCTITEPYSFFLLDEQISEILKHIIVQNIPFRIVFEKRFKVSTFYLIIVFFSLTMITTCVIIIFYLICCIYSTINPIITEYELRRFKLVKYKDIVIKDSDSCLICFDVYNDEDDIRILFCNHFFHQKCVDKWLCEQSSKCPYCRYTNKSYDAV